MFNYTIKSHPKSKGIKISIKPGGDVVVTKPKRVSKRAAQKVIEENIEWIKDRVEKTKDKNPMREQLKGSKKEYEKYKKQALKLAKERVEFFSKLYKLNPSRVSIRNQSTRWGSCSSKKTLSLHYKIAKIPKDLADYIIVHELCHLKEMNHSKRFWKLVAQTMPNYKQKRKLLKTEAF